MEETVAKAVGVVARAPPSLVERGIPFMCSMRAYEPAGDTPFWEARLPKGKTFQAPDASILRNARRRSWRVGLRTQAQAKDECLAWLWHANAAGALD